MQEAITVAELALESIETEDQLAAAIAALEAAIVGLVEITPDVSAATIHALVERFEKEGEFKDAQKAHALKTHLTAVVQYEKQEAADKIVKHMKNFIVLLDHQKDSKLISEKAYNALQASADGLIKKWQ
ncbi:FIMAH domain-containing protein [Sporosarcina sp. NPDC096371]|uniref:FIMAH domain-containing protein n=1 Tax=Sporosarcina sp. NPDC096371 TaxID=3364530 RepID=UPI0037FB5FED